LTNFVLTDDHTNRAYVMGRVRAAIEIELGNTVAAEVAMDEEDIRQLAWEITTVKLDPDSDEAEMLASAYSDGYYEVWEENYGT
jgi:hypothetical protein